MLKVVLRPLVTVLTPVHNGEAFLAECIESVIGQTYLNWEYFIVDNCSTDRTRDIAEGFARADKRIRCLHNREFLDAVANHNRGFRTISPGSAYCKVVQADDSLVPECLERMVDLAERHRTVGIISAYRRAGDIVDLVGVPYEQTVVLGRQALRQSLLGGPYVTGTPTSLLLRSKLVRQRIAFYDQSFRHADTEAAYWAMTRSDFGFVHQVLTFTRRQSTGETPVSLRVNSHSPESIRMLMRYGPAVLSELEYRARLRYELGRYVRWHAKQALKPSRLRDRDFHAYQRSAIDAILDEGGSDQDVRRAMSIIGLLLRSGALKRRTKSRPTPHSASKRTSHRVAGS